MTGMVTDMNRILYVMGGKWTNCKLPRDDFYSDMKTSIIWQNRLVALSYPAARELFVYDPKEEDGWSVKDTLVPYVLYSGSFFLNVENHLCIEGGRETDSESDSEEDVVCRVLSRTYRIHSLD